MFPCSIYQHFPLSNQTWKINDHDHDHDSNTFEIDDPDQNSIMISSNHDDDRHQKHSSPHSNDAIPLTFEDDGVMLSHLLSQQQLLCCDNASSTYSRDLADEMGIVASDRSHEIPDQDHDNHSHDHDRQAKPAKGQCSLKKQGAKPAAKRPSGKKDRHSKICTAQGLRDRRMRLSLQIARQFFDLQDMLGFDKASRTIEWLFSKSKTAITELKGSLVAPRHRCLGSSNSNPDRQAVSRTGVKIGIDDDREDWLRPEGGLKRMRKLHKVVARESRDKARARARERTQERMLEKSRRSTSTTTNTTAASEAENQSSVDLGKPRPNLEDLKMAAPSEQLQLDYSSASAEGHVGVSNISGENSEEDFLGFSQNWEILNCSSETQAFCLKNMSDAFRVGNPCPILTQDHLCSTRERKPSSIKVSTSSNATQAQNPSLVFMSTTTSNAQNPNPIFNDHDHEQNMTSNFLAGPNIFYSLNF